VKNDVTYQRPEVDRHYPDWEKVNDVVSGERAVKEKQKTYLPKPNPTDLSAENTTRYEQYVDRAVFFNATGRTLDGLIGIAFGKGPEVDVPASMEFVRTDVDGAGGGIANQSHRVLEEILKVGRCGMLVDHPQATGAISKAQQLQGNIHATITTYSAESIINWRTDARQNLVLIVLHEDVYEPDNYAINEVEQWRELAMGTLSTEENGATRYVVRLWRLDEKKEPYIHEEFVPTDASGKPWSYIPFAFVGAVDNNTDIDKSPLLDLACLNIAHYRNSADYEESAYFVGQPTFAFAGLDDQWMKDYWKDGVYVGSRAAIPLPPNGSATMLAAPPNILAGEAMRNKETQMVALGARLLTHGEAIKTAEQSRTETAAAHSVLSLAVSNMVSAYNTVLEWVAMFTSGSTGTISYDIDTNFASITADPNYINAVVAAWQSGALPKYDMFAAWRNVGLVPDDKSNEDIEDELDAEGGGLNLDAPIEQP